MEMVLNGGKIPVEIERWIIENGNKLHETTTVYVDIFKGIDHNEIIMLKDQGNIVNENCKGDIKIFISVNNDSCFSRRGLDLIMEKVISLKESLCGFSFDLKYINGKTYTINNLPGNIIPPEYLKVIPNMGLTREGHTGNLIIHFHTKFPETLTKENIDALSKIL
jgi:DnaJ family protein A protein 2